MVVDRDKTPFKKFYTERAGGEKFYLGIFLFCGSAWGSISNT